MEHLQQQIAHLQNTLAAREDQIAQLGVEAQGAAQAVNAAKAEAAAARQSVEEREAQINNLNNQLRNAQPGPQSPSESVLKKLQTPHILRDLPCYDGNPIKLHQFLRAIDNIMPVIEEARGTPMYSVWIQCIRSKITGDADTVLELYGTELSWLDIKTNLITHYSDKRDEISLTRDLFKLSQTGTVEEFYGKVSHIISLLLNQLCLNELNRDIRASKKSFYQEIGLKVFVAGLKEPLGPIIRAQSPKSMREALRLCSEEGNYNYVKNPFKTHVPPIPPKPQYQTTPNPQFKILHHPPMPKQPLFQTKPFQSNFHPQPKPFINNPNNNPFRKFPNPPPFIPHRQQPPTQNAFAPRFNPQPKPVPMEVDPSIRSRRINYMNRPNFHIEHDPYNYGNCSQYEDSNYYYYPEPHNETYDTLQSTEYDSAEYAVETHNPTAESDEHETKETEQSHVDDLNFQLTTDTTETT